MRANSKVISRRLQTPEAKLDGMPERLGAILCSRGIQQPDELLFSNRDLESPASLSNVSEAAHLVCDHVRQGSTIVIVGDYDADGATSCALSVLALRQMGAARVEYVVPDRFKHGYGLSPALVEDALALQPELLITVDNGIASLAGVAHARKLSIDVVVTDHHLPGDSLPEANSIVNPNLVGDLFPSKNLAGVGVVFYLLSMVRRLLESGNWFQQSRITPPNLAEFLDLVALGTYADLVRLDRNNRILVAQGLKRINAGRCRPGITALAEVAGKVPGALLASDLGFQLAPRLNAAGRLEDISLGIECLLAEDGETARRLASHLDEINQARKQIENRMNQDAREALQALKAQSAGDEACLCLYDESWHEGLVGLVASRLKERWSVPVVAFARGDNGDLKGSARSVQGVHIRDVLCEIDATQPGLIIRFGGHAMAAGLSIAEADFSAFRTAWEKVLGAQRQQIEAANAIFSDGPLDAEIDDLGFIRQLKTIAPWGQGFPEPVFDGRFQVLEQRLVGEVHLKMVLRSLDSHRVVDAIHFRYLDHPGAPCENLERIHAAYRVDVNEYAGRVSPQLVVEYLQTCQ